MTLDGHYQVLTLELEDGRKIEATVPAFCDPQQGIMPAILKIDITDPVKLPDGMQFMKMPIISG